MHARTCTTNMDSQQTLFFTFAGISLICPIIAFFDRTNPPCCESFLRETKKLLEQKAKVAEDYEVLSNRAILLKHQLHVLRDQNKKQWQKVTAECAAINTYGLPGPKGVRGKTGNPGEIGDPGRPGERGNCGQPGLPGTPGDRGQPGGVGITGPPGPEGLRGPNGDPGDGNIPSAGFNRPNGTAGPPGPAGENGGLGPSGPDGFPGSVGPFGQSGRACCAL